MQLQQNDAPHAKYDKKPRCFQIAYKITAKLWQKAMQWAQCRLACAAIASHMQHS